MDVEISPLRFASVEMTKYVSCGRNDKVRGRRVEMTKYVSFGREESELCRCAVALGGQFYGL